MDLLLIISHVGTDSRLRRTELAGRPFVEHLHSHIESLATTGVSVLDFEADTSEGLTKARFDIETGSGILFIGADVWFSIAALQQLVTKSSSQQTPIKVVSQKVSETEGDQDPDVLCVYLPAAIARSLFVENDISTVRYGLKRISDSILDEDIIGGCELDSVQPPIRVKNLEDLVLLEQNILYARAVDALRQGILIRDPNNVVIRGELQCGTGVEIDRNVIMEGRVSLGNGVKVGANSILINTTIGAHTRVHPFSIIEDAVIGANTFIGPFGRVRPGSDIGDGVQVGNFVEIKNSEVGDGSRINHLAFVGDASLSQDVTIGAGTITCNHNGVTVSRIQIGKGAYVGSGSQLIAPLEIGENATVGAGSTITEDVPAGKLTVARSRQVTVDNWVRPTKETLGK